MSTLSFAVGRHPHPITISWLGRGHSGLKRHIDVQAGFSWAQSGMTEYPRPQPIQHFTGKSLFSIFHDPFPDLFHGRSSRVQRMISPPLGLPPGVDRPEPAGICLTIPLGPYWLTGLPPLLQMLHVDRLDSRKHSHAEGSSQPPSAGRCFLGRHTRRLWQMPRKRPK